jgi:acetolactate synthase-1/2/3 large subunit
MSDRALSRRDVLKLAAAGPAVAALPGGADAGILPRPRRLEGHVVGHLTGAQALVDTLLAEGADCVFGIPGAQENELWDTMKARGLGYLLVTHEFAAAGMADGYARSTGRPGVIAVVPGPGLTNALSGLGEALLDSVPIVAIVGDVARGEHYRPFQVHEIAPCPLLQAVTKTSFVVKSVAEIPWAVRQAFTLAKSGEPGPVAVVVPYNLFIEAHHFDSAPVMPPPVPFDDAAFHRALALLSDRRLRVGIYAGMGCMDASHELTAVAELLQAPVATTISGKGVIPENHPLAVGWGYGPQGTRVAECVFKDVDVVLAIGVRFGEVSTAFYSIPKHRHVIHVDINEHHLGRIVPTEVCVHAEAGLFLSQLLAQADCLRRPPNGRLIGQIAHEKRAECQVNAKIHGRCGVDPMHLVLALRRCLSGDALVFVDVAAAQHFANEAFIVCQPRTYFNPTDNQAMGWSIPASLGGQRAFPGRTTVTLTGDGCFLMSMVEISTAAREGLPVKFFVLDDQAYHLMQVLQQPAYLRTTATVLARLDYAALAKGLRVGYHEIVSNEGIDDSLRMALCQPGPVLTRVVTDYGDREIRWITATKKRFTKELSFAQKTRFIARVGSRAMTGRHDSD